jgi:hypothetical protein
MSEVYALLGADDKIRCAVDERRSFNVHRAIVSAPPRDDSIP